MARKLSAIRISTSSSQPPKNPADTPTITPTAPASSTLAAAISTDSLMPNISRAAMFRPSSSVPSQLPPFSQNGAWYPLAGWAT